MFIKLCGCDINAVEASSHTELISASERGDVDTVCHQLDLGANVNSINRKGYSSILIACFKGHSWVVDILIKRGADINKPNPQGWTPSHAACYYGHVGVLCLLLAGGANIDAKTASGMTPGTEFDREVPLNVRAVIMGMLEAHKSTTKDKRLKKDNMAQFQFLELLNALKDVPSTDGTPNGDGSRRDSVLSTKIEEARTIMLHSISRQGSEELVVSDSQPTRGKMQRQTSDLSIDEALRPGLDSQVMLALQATKLKQGTCSVDLPRHIDNDSKYRSVDILEAQTEQSEDILQSYPRKIDRKQSEDSLQSYPKNNFRQQSKDSLQSHPRNRSRQQSEDSLQSYSKKNRRESEDSLQPYSRQQFSREHSEGSLQPIAESDELYDVQLGLQKNPTIAMGDANPLHQNFGLQDANPLHKDSDLQVENSPQSITESQRESSGRKNSTSFLIRSVAPSNLVKPKRKTAEPVANAPSPESEVAPQPVILEPDKVQKKQCCCNIS